VYWLRFYIPLDISEMLFLANCEGRKLRGTS